MDAQLRSSRAAEQEWRRKAEALAQELLRAQELGETTQQQLKSAMAQADGSLQSMRELEGSYAALDAEMGRARAQLERERDEHAATKRLLQRAAQEAQEMAEEVRVLVTRPGVADAKFDRPASTTWAIHIYLQFT